MTRFLNNMTEDSSLTVDELVHGVAEVMFAELAKRDARIAALEAELRKRDDPDLDGRLNVKRAAQRLACSGETIRRKAAAGKLDAAKDRGQWRIKLP